MTNTVIDIENLSVAYKMYAKPLDQLKELAFGGVRHETFWALRNINLKIAEGERVGIVGPNGAGKSTLLKIVAGTMSATSGRVSTHGQISSLLSMVPAWNDEETGIENIKFNLLLKGVPQRQIPSLVEEIADFTELGQFLFNPVKTYSTGMSARLSFGIATATEPEILIVDEVLGTGDGYFAWKAMKRMQDFCAKGRAMILVSHAIATVQSMCDRVIWMQNGEVRMDGAALNTLSAYELDYRRVEDETQRASHAARSAVSEANVGELTDAEHIRLRIVPETRAPFYSSHYIAEIGVQFGNGPRVTAPLEIVDHSSQDQPAALDLLNSEWARIFEKDGRECRVLTRVAGRNFGGQFLVRRPSAFAGKLSVDMNVLSADERETLRVEVLEMTTGLWVPLINGPAGKKDGWPLLRFSGEFAEPNADAIEKTARLIGETTKPVAEILSVRVIANGSEVTSVTERQPFEIQVRVLFNRAPEIADVGIKFTRMDGAYVFWQSSGMTGENLFSPEGEKLIAFKFDENVLGAAEYFVNAHVTNGWKYPDNYPYSEVFARKINAAMFRVAPEFRDLDLGAVNHRARVEVK